MSYVRSRGRAAIGIPKDSVVKYETALKPDQLVLIVHDKAAQAINTYLTGSKVMRKTNRRNRDERATTSAGQSGDIQQLPDKADADSESVTELVEEGNAFEADAVAGVEDAKDPDVAEVTTHEVPEDDIPLEYLDNDNDNDNDSASESVANRLKPPRKSNPR
jgi:hypothetical protein